MLRRRILASAMASVMALGSVAVVANAEETAVKAVKTKADLEALIASYEDFRSNELYDYGSISGENFLSALEYADNVLADDKANVDDYTVAYAMIEAVYNRLTIYTADELKALVDSCTSIIETNNIYNEELGDAIYSADSFSDFETAYYDAEAVLDSADSRIITDAYEELAAKKAGLSKLDVVSKSQFRTALKAYETALQKEYAYDTWRVGTVKSSFWGYGQSVAYGTLYEHVVSVENEINKAYEELDEIKALNKTSQPNLVQAYKICANLAEILNGFTPDDTGRATKASVQSLLNQYHGRLVHDYNYTSAVELYDAVVKAVGANSIKVLQWTGDYSSDYVATTDDLNPWFVDDADYSIDPNGGRYKDTETKLISAEISVKSDVPFYIGLDDNGVWNGNVSTDKTAVGEEYKQISKKAAVDLTQFIGVTAAMVDEKTDNHRLNNVVDGDCESVTYSKANTDTFYDELCDYVVAKEGTWVISGLTTLAKGVTADTFKTFDKLLASKDWKDNKKLDKSATDEGFVAADDAYNAIGWAHQQALTFYEKTKDGQYIDASISYQIGQWGIDGVSNFDTISATHLMGGFYNGNATFTDLGVAMQLAETYLEGDKDSIKKMDMTARGVDIDTTETIAEDSAKGSSAEWAMVYRYLKYALTDKYDASYGTHTKAEVEALIEKAYELAELTGDAALFSYNHNVLVEARQNALAWVKAANKDKKYKDNVSAPQYKDEDKTGVYSGKVATQVYDALWSAYEALQKDYNAFKYSFDEIYIQIAETKVMIDDGDLDATADVVKALDDTAYLLSVIKPLVDGDENVVAENEAFTSDRFFQGFNRLFTNKDSYDLTIDKDTKVTVAQSKDGGKNASHLALQEAYEALLAAIKAQTEVTVLKGDVDGNGTVNALDASALLVNVVNGVTMDAAVADYDANGAINALDAAAILTAIVNA